MAGTELARPCDAMRVHPAASDDLVADPERSAAEPGQQRRAWAAVKIDRQIVAVAPQAGPEPQVFTDSREAARSGRDDDFVEMWIALDDRSGNRFDDVSNSC